MKRVKILHLLESSKFSGAENVVCQIITMMKENQNLEMVYCSRNGTIKKALNDRNITFCPIERLSIKEVKRVIIEQKPDIIHAHDMRASFVSSLACGKIPLVSHIHNNAFDSRSISLKSIAYSLAAMKARHIIWVSRSSFEGYVFHEKFRKKSSVLYNIIDLDNLYERMYQDQKKYNYDIIFVGRLTYPKNPQYLMNVLAELIKKKKDVKIAIVGSGDLDDEIKALANTLGIANNVDFLGFQPNPLKILKDSKVMIMTSRWEGTPMCVLEAMGLGVPVVSTAVDGIKDLIINDVNGFLTNDLEEMVNKLLNIIEDNNLRAKLSFNQMDLAKKINDKKAYIEKLNKIYSKK